MDKRAEILRLAGLGHGDRHIIKVLDVTRYQVAQTLREAKAKKDAATGIPVDLIDANPKARPLVAAHVAALVQSIPTIGLLVPISVRHKNERYELIAGGHRTQAFRELGRETIPAIVIDVDDLTAELMLIDENLIRQDLSPAERSIALRRRKAIYEELHPETKQGRHENRSNQYVAPKVEGGQLGHLPCDKPIDIPAENVSRETSAPMSDTSGAPSAPAERAERFTAGTAKATGISERTVRRAVTRGNAIGVSALKKIVGTSLDKGEELDALAKLPAPKRDELIKAASSGKSVSAKPEVKRVIREEREAELAKKQKALPDKKFGVILADPEWRFEPWSRETGMDRAADNHYSTSSTEVIKARPVETIAAPDCVLFLWATAPMLPQALDVMKAWGFAYKTHAIWLKERPGNARGPGYWFTGEHELLLVGTRGSVPAPAPGNNWRSVLKASIGRHSEKPVIVHEMIEAYFPTLPKIELNARSGRSGWEAWGAEAPASPSLYGDSPMLSAHRSMAAVGEAK